MEDESRESLTPDSQRTPDSAERARRERRRLAAVRRARRRGLTRLALVFVAAGIAAFAISQFTRGSSGGARPARQLGSDNASAGSGAFRFLGCWTRTTSTPQTPWKALPHREALPGRVYVPNSESGTVSVINPATYQVIDQFPVGANPQHVVPSYDLKTLWVNNDQGNSLTAIDPRNRQTGSNRSGQLIPTTSISPLTAATRSSSPSALHVSISATRRRCGCTTRSRSRAPASTTWTSPPMARYLLTSCEFDGKLIKVDVAREKVVARLAPSRRDASGRKALARRAASSTSPTCPRTASGSIDAKIHAHRRLHPDRSRARTGCT